MQLYKKKIKKRVVKNWNSKKGIATVKRLRNTAIGYNIIIINVNFNIFVEVVSTDNEFKSNIDNDCSTQSIDGKMSKSEIKIARQSQRKRY